MPEMKFEKALERLEQIVDDLESGKLSLDEALARYEEGAKMVRLCAKRLDGAKRKIDLLVKKESGLALEVFEEETGPDA